MTKYNISNAYVRQAVEALILASGILPGAKIYGIPRGGVAPAYLLAGMIDGRVVNSPSEANFIIDDLVDSGATMTRYARQYPNTPRGALFWKGHHRLANTCAFGSFHVGLQAVDQWLVFPWEESEDHDTSAEDAVVRMLQAIGDDPNREGLLETPRRVVKAWGEWFKGYGQDPADFMKTFEDGAEGCDEMVLLTDIPVYSHCEHHVTPFIGIAHVAYIPNGKIVGLSKIARVVEVFSRRLQVQERLTNQIANCLEDHLKPLGVAVVIKAKHFCMATRGVKMPNVDTTTSAMRGVFLTKPEARAEFMGLIKP